MIEKISNYKIGNIIHKKPIVTIEPIVHNFSITDKAKCQIEMEDLINNNKHLFIHPIGTTKYLIDKIQIIFKN